MRLSQVLVIAVASFVFASDTVAVATSNQAKISKMEQSPSQRLLRSNHYPVKEEEDESEDSVDFEERGFTTPDEEDLEERSPLSSATLWKFEEEEEQDFKDSVEGRFSNHDDLNVQGYADLGRLLKAAWKTVDSTTILHDTNWSVQRVITHLDVAFRREQWREQQRTYRTIKKLKKGRVHFLEPVSFDVQDRCAQELRKALGAEGLDEKGPRNP
eukprot:jgi/Phyca11/19192/fgenesh1_pg.PHYCAscaffold_46_\